MSAQSEMVKQMYTKKEIQDGDFTFYLRDHSKRGFPGIFGSIRSLSSHTNSTGTSKVSTVCLQWTPHYQYRALPFGLKSSPRVFTKILVTLVAHLHVQEMALFPYLNDILVKAPSRAQGEEAIQRTPDCLRAHGFVINIEKSTLTPSQSIIHLGVQIDTQWDKVFISVDRAQKTNHLLRQVLDQNTLKLTDLMRLLGMMVSCQGMVAWSRFHLRPLHRFLRPYQKEIAHKGPLQLELPQTLRAELQWWLKPTLFKMGMQLREPNRILVMTDPSLTSWGAHTGSQMTQGT